MHLINFAPLRTPGGGDRSESSGKVWLSYNDLAYLAKRHATGECGGAVQQNAQALKAFAGHATGSGQASPK